MCEVYTKVTLNGLSAVEEGKQFCYKCTCVGGSPVPYFAHWYLKFPNNTEKLLTSSHPNSTLYFTPHRSHNGISIYCTMTQLVYKPPSISNIVTLNVQC